VSKQFVNIEVDRASAKALQSSMKQYGRRAIKAITDGIKRTALAIETDAKRRLNGQLGSAKHWITGRLAASVHTEMEGLNSFDAVAESKQKDSNLQETVSDMEGIVGTNVEYADKIEFDYDSFLRFAAERQSRKFSKRVEQELNKIK